MRKNPIAILYENVGPVPLATAITTGIYGAATGGLGRFAVGNIDFLYQSALSLIQNIPNYRLSLDYSQFASGLLNAYNYFANGEEKIFWDSASAAGDTFLWITTGTVVFSKLLGKLFGKKKEVK